MNFVHGYPNVCVSVGLLINKAPQLAIVYNPVLEQWFQAVKGQGATLNGLPIKVSKESGKYFLSISIYTYNGPFHWFELFA